LKRIPRDSLAPVVGVTATDDVRKGYHDVRVKMRVKSNANPDQLAELATYSPVYDIVSNSLPVHVLIETF